MCQSPFFWLTLIPTHKRHTELLSKNEATIHGVLSTFPGIDKASTESLWLVVHWTARKWHFWKISVSKLSELSRRVYLVIRLERKDHSLARGVLVSTLPIFRISWDRETCQRRMLHRDFFSKSDDFTALDLSDWPRQPWRLFKQGPPYGKLFFY